MDAFKYILIKEDISNVKTKKRIKELMDYYSNETKNSYGYRQNKLIDENAMLSKIRQASILFKIMIKSIELNAFHNLTLSSRTNTRELVHETTYLFLQLKKNKCRINLTELWNDTMSGLKTFILTNQPNKIVAKKFSVLTTIDLIFRENFNTSPSYNGKILEELRLLADITVNDCKTQDLEIVFQSKALFKYMISAIEIIFYKATDQKITYDEISSVIYGIILSNTHKEKDYWLTRKLLSESEYTEEIISAYNQYINDHVSTMNAFKKQHKK